MSAREDDEGEVSIQLRAKARALEVHEVRGASVRAWGSPAAHTEHRSRRVGLPAQVRPGERYGPLEVELQVSSRLPDVDPKAAPRSLPAEGPGRKVAPRRRKSARASRKKAPTSRRKPPHGTRRPR